MLIDQTVQSESRTCEAIFVFESELSNSEEEIWDQPTPIQLRRDKGAKGIHVASYTPDYLRLPKLSKPALVQCKTRNEIDRLIIQKPQDWAYIDGKPQFLPARDAAEKIGLAHEVFVSEDWASPYLFNLEFLHALRVQAPAKSNSALVARIKAKVANAPLTIFELCAAIRDLEPAIIYRLLASGELFGAFKAQLVSQEDVFRVFSDSAAASQFEVEALKVLRSAPETRDENLAAILKATPTQLAHATTLAKGFEEVQLGQRKPTRTEYRYLPKFQAIAKANGHTTAAFIPRFPDRGNCKSRLSPQQDTIIAQKVDACVKTGTPKSVSALTGQVNDECEKQGIPKVSCESVRLRFINARAEDVAKGRLGNRGYHNALRPVSSKHATLRSEIAGLLAHVDSTQFDDRVWAQSPLSNYLECPWIYVIYDEACSRSQGFWIGFGKSDRFALSLAIRDAACRQGSLPLYLFSDRGAEYNSIWYEVLLAQENITKYARPAGAPRFGGLQESCLKQINAQLAQRLAGNTWADQKGRSASGNKKSRATARLALELVVDVVRDFLFNEWNNGRHGTADASPNELWELSRAQFGDVGRPVKHDDLAFLIATSIPVEATLGERKGIRIGYREYWNDELNAIRKPFRLDEARLDPSTPSILYVKVKSDWFITHSRDHATVRTLTQEGQFFESHRVRSNAAATRRSGKSSQERMARRMDELETSNAALVQADSPTDATVEQTTSSAETDLDLDQYADIPFLPSKGD